jgi:serine/threonine protein kinase
MANSPAAPGGALSGGRYRIERPLGSGGMATVWLAHDQELDRPVAVKVLADTLAVDDGYVARFRREARIAAGLSHPNLVKVWDFSEEDDRPFLVMEYASGGTLRGRADVDGAELARSLLAALDHIHAAGIVHRDIKPANVLFDAAGRPRLTDFGIAHPEDATSLTQTGQIIGTLRYMAPEVAAGQPATRQSDLYSLGVVLREAAADDARIIPLVDALTRERPDRRPASARDALAILDDDAKPTRQLYAPGPARRKALAIAAAVIAVGALVIVLATSGGRGGPFSGTTTRTDRSTAAPAPAGAPLARQLDALDRAVGRARR